VVETSKCAACPVCGSQVTDFFARARDVEYLTTDEQYEYRFCRDCHCVFLLRPPSDQLSVIYPANYYSYRRETGETSLADKIKERLDRRLFNSLLNKLPGESLSVLDVGGGSGWLLTLMRHICPRITETHEVDIDDTARDAAEKSGHVFHCCRVEKFSSDRQFDLILMLNLIEHVPDPAAVLTTMHKLLSPQGLLLIKTPNHDTLDRRLFRNHNWGGFHCPRHFVLFDKDSLIQLGTQCGLACRSAKYTQGAPQWTTSALGYLYLRGWIRISRQKPMYLHPLYSACNMLFAAFDFLRLPFSKTAQMIVVFRRAEGDTGISDANAGDGARR